VPALDGKGRTCSGETPFRFVFGCTTRAGMIRHVQCRGSVREVSKKVQRSGGGLPRPLSEGRVSYLNERNARDTYSYARRGLRTSNFAIFFRGHLRCNDAQFLPPASTVAATHQLPRELRSPSSKTADAHCRQADRIRRARRRRRLMTHPTLAPCGGRDSRARFLLPARPTLRPRFARVDSKNKDLQATSAEPRAADFLTHREEE
jgi:hypothetical protein